MNEMDEYRALFLEESEEYITALNENLIALEKDSNNRKLIDNIFRIAHTLKSSAAAVGFEDLSVLAHKSEDLMQKIRSEEKEIDTGITDVLFEVFDIVQAYIKCIKADKEIDVDTVGIIKKLENIIKGKGEKKVENKKKKESNEKKRNKGGHLKLNEYERKQIEAGIEAGQEAYSLQIEIDPREQLKWLRAELVINIIKKTGEIIKIYPDKEKFLAADFGGIFTVVIVTGEKGDTIKEKLMIDLIKDITVENVMLKDTDKGEEETKDKKQEREGKDRGGEEKESKGTRTKDYQITASSDTIKVPVQKMDSLMNLVGELVIANSGLKQVEEKMRSTYKDKEVCNDMNGITERIVNISSDLQYSIMNARMLPLSNVFHQFYRVVRDLAKEQGKEINLILKGEDTELDKKVIDAIGEPLMHLVRNAIDHGIETKAEREKKKKAKEGKITLKAFQAGNRIIISVKDDGCGINIEKVKEYGVKKGLVSKDDIKDMSWEQISDLIFAAGFSTSEKVSSISGRGVGLDVVKNAITELSGTVEIKTGQGKGTEFIIALPLTLATSLAVLVKAGDTYAIPITDIQETLKIHKEEIKGIDGYKAINLRDEVLPLISLNNVFDDKKIVVKRNEKIPVIVISYQNKKAGVIVDRILGEKEIVLKPLEKHYQSVKGLSGAAILGDGSIILVVDVVGLINLVKVKQERGNDFLIEIEAEKAEEEKKEKKSEAIVKEKEIKDKKEEEKEEETCKEKKEEDTKGTIEKDEQLNNLFNEAFSEAAISLSMLTNKTMEIYSSKIELLTGDEFANQIEDKYEEPYFASIIKTKDDLNTNIVFLISKKDGFELYDYINGSTTGTTKEASEDIISGIGEINNILGCAFVNNIANLMKKEIHPSPPLNNFDMLGAVLEGVVLQEEFLNKRIFCADTVIKEKDKEELRSRLLIMSDKESLFNTIKRI